VIEVDCPGLTSPVLANFYWQRLPRPMIPIGKGVDWSPPSAPSAPPRDGHAA